MNAHTLISELTVWQLEELIRSVMDEYREPKPSYVYGIEGLCQIFNCSPSTAKRIKASGSIDRAIRQQGRTFVTNVDLALQLYGSDHKRHSR